jgi:hypothetical protein
MELADPCEILIEKLCRRCEQWKNMELCFRPGNHVCRMCRNEKVKEWTASNPIRREIIRTKARRSAYIQRMAKRQKLQDNNVIAQVVAPVEHSTEGGDEQVASV